jgi:hypothetical protein
VTGTTRRAASTTSRPTRAPSGTSAIRPTAASTARRSASMMVPSWGTYAWIDDNGFLRQRDYIADNAGYRILKTKNLFVGRETPIAQAIKSAKKVSPSAGTLVKTNSVPTPSPTPYVEIKQNSIPSSTPSPYQYSTTAAPPSTVSPIKNLYLPANTGESFHRHLVIIVYNLNW